MADSEDFSIGDVKELLGMSFLGFAMATTFYGISILQIYLYYRNYRSDSRGLKLTVATLFLLDTLASIFVGHTLYTYYVLNFGKDLDQDLEIPWSFTAERLCVTLIAFIAQCFYARMIWKTSRGLVLTFAVVALAVITLALGFTTTVHLFQTSGDTSELGRVFQILSGLVQGLAAFNDFLITTCLCMWLYMRKKGSSGWGVGDAFVTGNFIDRLIIYIISRGLLTAVAQAIFLALNLRYPDETYWLPWHVVVGKLYVNSVLASLNVRRSFVAVDESDFSGQIYGEGRTGAGSGTAGSGLKSLGFSASAGSGVAGSLDLVPPASERVSEKEV